jgi:hypothetical protein
MDRVRTSNFLQFGRLSFNLRTGQSAVTIDIPDFVEMINRILTFARDEKNQIYLGADGIFRNIYLRGQWDYRQVCERLKEDYPDQMGAYPERTEDESEQPEDEPADTYIDVGRMFGE